MTDAKPSLKAKALHEFARFATMFAYLWAMFLLFQIHQYVVLAQHQIPFTQFGVGFMNALVLAKVMLVADDLRLGEWRGRRPLIYPVLLRSVLFAIVFIVFDVIEKVVIGMYHGKAVAESIQTLGAAKTSRRDHRRDHYRRRPCSILRLRGGEPLDGPWRTRANLLHAGTHPCRQRSTQSIARIDPVSMIAANILGALRSGARASQLVGCLAIRSGRQL